MKVSEIIERLELTVYSLAGDPEQEVTGGYVSDLLSDVMGNADAGQVWITLQTHRNIIAIAGLKDLSAIILVNGLEPDQATLDESRNAGITLLGTRLSTFEIAGRLYGIIRESVN